MACIEEMGLKISRYLDGELPHDERPTLEAHIAECPSCAGFLGAARRTDELVGDALHHAFSPDRIWERIQAECDEDEEETEAEEEEPLRLAPARASWMRIAAGFAAVAAIAGVIYWQSAQLQRLRERTDAVLAIARDAEQRTRGADERLAALARDLDAQMRVEQERTVQQALRHLPESTVAFVDSGTVYITTHFPDAETYERFDVERRRYGQARWEGFVNRDALPRPEFVDESAEPGATYEYRFIGVRDGRQVPGVPVTVTYPEAAPEGGVEVRFFSISEDGLTAGLIVEGPEGACSVEVAVGATVEIAGRTWTLERVADADEHLTATFAWPMTDEEGRPVYSAETGQPKIELQDRVLSVRRNRRAHFACGDDSFQVWLRGRARLP